MQTCDPLSQLESQVPQTQILRILILNQIPALSTQSSEVGQMLGTDVGAASHRTITYAGENLKYWTFFFYIFLPYPLLL